MKTKVVGIEDTGCRIAGKMFPEPIQDVEFIAINSEAQFQGFDVDMVLLIAGMGDCTTLTTELVAAIARESGVLTIALVTTPFSFEGKDHLIKAEERIKRLIHEVDSLFIIHNDRLLDMSRQKVSTDTGLWLSDEVVQQSVRAIAEVIAVNGLIQLDFDDVKAVMKNAGSAWMSFGRGTGNNRISDAVKMAIVSPLLNVPIRSTNALLLKIVGGADLTLYEVNQAAEVIKQSVDPDANIIFGVDRDPVMANEVRITLIGTDV